MAKFLIITRYGIKECEAEDFEHAVCSAYDDHTKYEDVFAIVRGEENRDDLYR